jgi:hypothetical protein
LSVDYRLNFQNGQTGAGEARHERNPASSTPALNAARFAGFRSPARFALTSHYLT